MAEADEGEPRREPRRKRNLLKMFYGGTDTEVKTGDPMDIDASAVSWLTPQPHCLAGGGGALSAAKRPAHPPVLPSLAQPA